MRFKIILLLLFFISSDLYSREISFKSEALFISKKKIQNNIINEQKKVLNYIGYNYFKFLTPSLIWGISDCIIDDKNFAKLNYDYHLTYGLELSSKSIFNLDNFNIGYEIKYLLTDFKDILALPNTHLKQKILESDLICSYILANFFEPKISIGYFKDSFANDFNLTNEKKISLKIGWNFNLTDYLRFNFSSSFLAYNSIQSCLEYDLGLKIKNKHLEAETQIIKQCPVCGSYYTSEHTYCGYDGIRLKIEIVPLNRIIDFTEFK